ncbi:MAG TPA: DUF4349 domain-containing protein [Candidatus Limnocylindrales bacterium]|jgi:hypothetical protein
MNAVGRQVRAVAVLLIVLGGPVLLVACSGSAAVPAPQATSAPATAPALGAIGAPVDDSGKPGSSYGSGGTPQQAASSPGPDTQLIVYEGSIDLQVDDVGASVDQANQLIGGLGGHVASSNASTKNDQDFATITYRIPAEKWDEALADMRAVGAKVLNETTTSEDVTGQVVDLNARIANAQASETALQAIMDKATTIDDVLSVQRELTQVRGDIESMTAQRDLLGNRAAFSTLTVSFETLVTQTQAVSGGWDLGQVFDDAVAALVRVGQGVITLGVWLVVVVLPIVVPLLVVLGVAVYLRRRWLRGHPGPDMTLPPTGASAV